VSSALMLDAKDDKESKRFVSSLFFKNVIIEEEADFGFAFFS
jgi:hypothetical protein